MALGVTMQLPVDDKHSYTKDYLKSQLAILMGGRVAEEMFMHHVTTGAGNDIERATDLARKMVCEWGMSDLGPMSFGKKEEQIFLGREIAQHRDYSESTAIEIDKEVRGLVDAGYTEAKNVLNTRQDALIRIAEALLEREILDGAEVKRLIDGGDLVPLAESKPKSTDDPRAGQVITPDGPMRVPPLEGGNPLPA
jgi:cell division protease FtsH